MDDQSETIDYPRLVDVNGDIWPLKVTGAHRKPFEAHDVFLLKLNDDTKIMDVMQSPIKCLALAEILCADQAKTKGITGDDWQGLIVDLDDLCEQVAIAIANFTLGRQRALMLQSRLLKAKTIAMARLEARGADIDQLIEREADKAIETLLQNSTVSPASVASTPTT